MDCKSFLGKCIVIARHSLVLLHIFRSCNRLFPIQLSTGSLPTDFNLSYENVFAGNPLKHAIFYTECCLVLFEMIGLDWKWLVLILVAVVFVSCRFCECFMLTDRAELGGYLALLYTYTDRYAAFVYVLFYCRQSRGRQIYMIVVCTC